MIPFKNILHKSTEFYLVIQNPQSTIPKDVELPLRTEDLNYIKINIIEITFSKSLMNCLTFRYSLHRWRNDFSNFEIASSILLSLWWFINHSANIVQTEYRKMEYQMNKINFLISVAWLERELLHSNSLSVAMAHC